MAGGVVANGVYFNTESGLNAPGGLLDQFLNPDLQLKQRQLSALDTFKDGLPKDLGVAGTALIQRGAFEPGLKLLEAGISQKQMADAGNLTAGMTKWLAPGGGGDAQPASAPAPGAPPSGGYMPLFRAAISNNESGGKYDMLGPVTKSGDRAFGRYGVMGANVGPWTKQYLGTEMTPEQFLANPQAQDAVFNGEFGRLLKVHGNPQDAASVWFTGKPYAQGVELKDQLGTTGAGYVDKFMTSLRSGDAARLARPGTSDAPAPTTTVPLAAPATDGRPIQLAQNGDSDAPPPSARHPYGVSTPAFTGPAGSPTARSYAPADAPQPAGPPPSPDTPTSAPGTSRPAPMPTTFAAPPPISPNAGAPTAADDPSYGGQVPRAWLAAGHSAADWVRYQRIMAAIGSGNPFAKGAAEQWSKSADGLQTSIEKRAELTTDQKNARDPVAFGAEIEKEKARGRARADAEAENALVPVAQPDGSVNLMPKKVAMAKAAQGEAVVHSLPGYVTSGQAALRTKLETGSAAYSERQVAGERLDALSNLLSNYQTGSGSTALNNAVARLRTFGIDVPNSAMANPATMQQFTKNAYANVLSSMREQGNKQFVAEVQSAVNSNPNTELQPEANAAMIAQMRGIQRYHDQNFRDYSEWYEDNRGASNDARFQIDWAKKHPVEPYIMAARKDIAPLGAALPPPGQLVDGQAYMVQGRGGQVKARWSAAAKHFIPARD